MPGMRITRRLARFIDLRGMNWRDRDDPIRHRANLCWHRLCRAGAVFVGRNEMSQELTLPWPDKVLSPNWHGHWAVKAKAVKAYRKACWALALEAKLKAPMVGQIYVFLAFHPPSKRRYDLDNAIASLKSGLDGLADALGVNDSRFSLKPAMGTPRPSGEVWVSICPN